jgi:hypothetical protein
MPPFDLEAYEAVAMASPVHERTDFSVLDPAIDSKPITPSDPDAPQAPPDVNLDAALPLASDLMTLDAWTAQWGGLHDMMGGVVQMRTGQPCPLGDQARSEGGIIASQALYGIIEKNPTLASMILSTKSTFIGQVMAIGMHGFGCFQVVRGSQHAAYVQSLELGPEPAPEFKSTRDGDLH